MLVSDLKVGDSVVVVKDIMNENSKRAKNNVLNQVCKVVTIDSCAYPIILVYKENMFRILPYDIELADEKIKKEREEEKQMKKEMSEIKHHYLSFEEKYKEFKKKYSSKKGYYWNITGNGDMKQFPFFCEEEE